MKQLTILLTLLILISGKLLAQWRHTAKSIKKKLLQENPDLIEEHKVNKYDRTYQIWKREPLSIELFTEKAFMQKLEYIPVRTAFSRAGTIIQLLPDW